MTLPVATSKAANKVTVPLRSWLCPVSAPTRQIPRLHEQDRSGLSGHIAACCAGIRVTSKYELKQRIIAGIDEVNRYPVIHTWSYTNGISE
jgi:hypothetical protein